MNLAWARTLSIRGLGRSIMRVGMEMVKLSPLVAVPEEVLLLSLPTNVMREWWLLVWLGLQALAELYRLF